MVRLFSAEIAETLPLSERVVLLTVHAPVLAQAAQPGQYCLLRCCSTLAYDPLLRRPFYLHSCDRQHGLCSFLVEVRGRGSRWLAHQVPGAHLEMLGPLGRGWHLANTVRNLLLVAEEGQIAALTFFAQEAIQQEVAVTLLYQSQPVEDAYPPALLSPEIEYHIVTPNLLAAIESYLPWADALCCSVSRETALALYNRYERVRNRAFTQVAVQGRVVCGLGACFLCTIETRTGPRLLCREGPVFDLREYVR